MGTSNISSYAKSQKLLNELKRFLFSPPRQPAVVLQQPSLQHSERQCSRVHGTSRAPHHLAYEVLFEIAAGILGIQSALCQSAYHLTVVLVEFRPEFVPQYVSAHILDRYSTVHMFRREAVAPTSRVISKPRPSRSGNTICRALDHRRLPQNSAMHNTGLHTHATPVQQRFCCASLACSSDSQIEQESSKFEKAVIDQAFTAANRSSGIESESSLGQYS